MAVDLGDLLPLVAFLQAEPEGSSDLRSLAERAELSPTHLQRVFARAIGESPKRLASRIQLERAAAELIDTDAKVIDIALASGFDSHEGFTRAFRRRFGTSPRLYRARGFAGRADSPATGPSETQSSPTESSRHREIVRRTAPCIGLYGRRLDSISGERREMSYEIVKKELDEIPILFQRKRIRQDQIADTLGGLFGAVWNYSVENGVEMAGPPFCRYADVSPGGMTLEAGMPIKNAVDGNGTIMGGVLQAGPAVTTIHNGPYEELPQAHAALERWLEENEVEPAGDPWEVYLTDPGQVPNPAEWKTEVIRPIRA